MPRLVFVVLLSAVSCANQQAAEREESDRLSSNDRSMPSAGDDNPRPPPHDDDLRSPPPQSGKPQGNINSAEVAAAAQAAANNVKAARANSAQQCAPLENRPVLTAEEDDMGLELALSAAASAPGGGLYADGVDEAGLRKAFEGRLTPLPPGDKSAVAAYVQKVGQALAGPKGRVTFVVVEDPQVRIESYLGGWVVVTSGMLAGLGNEADLAAVLAHQIAHLAAKDPLNEYARARFSACTIALTGANLVRAGAVGVPGGQDFVQGSTFTKTQQLFAAEDLAQALKTPQTDAAYVLYMLRQNLASQRMTRAPEAEQKADDATFAMLSAGGYETQAMARVAKGEGVVSSSERDAELAKRQRRGRTPPLPAALKWPK